MGTRRSSGYLNLNKGKYDSWDIENVNYIRRKSQSNLLDESIDMESGYNYNNNNNSTNNEFKESDSIFNGLHLHKKPSSGRVDNKKDGFSLITTKPLFHSDSEGNSNNIETRTTTTTTTTDLSTATEMMQKKQKMKETKEISLIDDGEEEPDVRLDNCYLLDVVTVRNESVLADTNNNYIKNNRSVSNRPIRASKIPIFVGSKVIPKIGPPVSSISKLKERNGSTGSGSNCDESHSSSASSISSVEENSNNSNDLNNLNISNKSKNNFSLDSGNRLYNPTMSIEKPPLYIQGGSVSSRSSCSASSDKRPGGGCPFCSDGSSTTSYYYIPRGEGSGKEFRRRRSCSRSIKDELEERTPSPYYVRLRRDLYNFSPTLCTPSNFGMDKQGQLVIDYSQNWEGLENYIRNLQLS